MVIRVTTEELRKRADDAWQKINKMSRDFQSIADLISQTAGCWQGEAGDLYRSIFEKEKPDMEKILKRLGEFPEDLLEMAGVYEGTEREIQALESSLPVDVIS
ncbi:MAG: WXG100 family type VII secretion target [Ruminococcus sp.]|jgi:WXG100 family type VII secretion target